MEKDISEKIIHGDYLVASRYGKDTDAALTWSVMPVSDSPSRIAFSIQKEHPVNTLISDSREAVISILSAQADDSLFRFFNSSKEEIPIKFRTDCNAYPYALTLSGIPYLLKHANAYLSCQVITGSDVGDSMLYLCDLTDKAVLNDTPSSVFHNHDIKKAQTIL